MARCHTLYVCLLPLQDRLISVCVTTPVLVGPEECGGGICCHQEGYLISTGALDCVLQSYREELEREQASHVRVERDLDEAMQKLLVVHKGIWRLTDELDTQRKEQSKIRQCFLCGCVPLLITGLHLTHPCSV